MVLLWVVFRLPSLYDLKRLRWKQVRCLNAICDKEFSMFPVPIGDWTPGAIAVISPNGIDLSVYDVYWGAGETIK